MIWQLMQRDRAMRMVPALSCLAALFLAAQALEAHWVRFHAAAIGALFFYVIVSILCLFGAGIHVRTTPFLAGLPIDGRQLLAARLLSMGAMIWIPAAILASGRAAGGGEDVVAPFKFAVGETLLVALAQCFRPRQMRAPLWPLLLILWPALGVFNNFPIALLMWRLREVISVMDASDGQIATVWSGVAAALSLVLLFKVWRSAPRSFELRTQHRAGVVAEAVMRPLRIVRAALPHSREVVKPSGERAGTDTGRVTSPAASLAWWAFRSFAPWAPVWLVLIPWMLHPHPSVSLFNTSAVFVACFAMNLGGLFPWLDTLPVDRSRVVLWGLTALVIAPIVGGYLVGVRLDFERAPYAAFADFFFGSQSRLELSRVSLTESQQWPPDDTAGGKCGVKNVMPPLEYWRPAPSGAAPIIEAPWGERFQPPVSAMLGLRIHDPFAVGCDSSRQFFEWQFARATETVYGTPLALSEPAPLKVPGVQSQIVNVALRTVWVLAVSAFGPLIRWRRRVLGMALAALSIAIYFVPYTAYWTLERGQLSRPTLEIVAQRIVWALPENSLVVVVAATVPVVLLFWAIGAVIRQAEFLASPAELRFKLQS